MSNKSQPINRLKALQLVQLYNWLPENLPTLAPGINWKETAEIISAQLGFKVSEGNVRDAVRQSGLSLPKAPASDNSRIGILKRAVEQLYKNLGQELPPEWADL